MGPIDIALTAVILAGASWLLYRTLVRQGGACGGCSQRGACQRPPTEVVQLRSGRDGARRPAR